MQVHQNNQCITLHDVTAGTRDRKLACFSPGSASAVSVLRSRMGSEEDMCFFGLCSVSEGWGIGRLSQELPKKNQDPKKKILEGKRCARRGQGGVWWPHSTSGCPQSLKHLLEHHAGCPGRGVIWTASVVILPSASQTPSGGDISVLGSACNHLPQPPTMYCYSFSFEALLLPLS